MINVLVVDDSALMRKLVSAMIEEEKELHVVGTAMNGKFALEKIPKLNPDIIVLDIEMPEMNGIEFLKERKKRGIHIPVIVLSSVAEKGAAVTMECISLGASDFVTKPSGSISVDVATVKERVNSLLLAYGKQYQRLYKRTQNAGAESEKNTKTPSCPAKKITPVLMPGRIELIVLGVSTGGPDALRVVLKNLSPNLRPPMIIVQHMPAGFTREFASSLDKICPLEVKEAAEGDEIVSGRILIAEGSKHLEVERLRNSGIVHLSDTPLVNGHRPSVDVLFLSAAMAYHNHVLGVIMTGMGRDGATQLGSIYREGGLTLGQDEASSVVYGMPRVAYEMGHVMEQVSLERMGQRICEVALYSSL
ncbi:MAG: chemotaxis response regulator protein-glutamate methylesterase [Spirochaetaceae bacterium]|jgi:two-component system chemotaxis response regulator CheB|nr:chemotaxis response regulator protein-glutamate methylesterase [Spirochaetaceae bacterium]GMO20647.1 MAG: chemotaxis response regulator protein-glutamate methylesterase [Termitinemataceae bacterium]